MKRVSGWLTARVTVERWFFWMLVLSLAVHVIEDMTWLWTWGGGK